MSKGLPRSLSRSAAAETTLLADNSGGSASDTIAVISATYSQTEVANAIASLAAKITELQNAIK